MRITIKELFHKLYFSQSLQYCLLEKRKVLDTCEGTTCKLGAMMDAFCFSGLQALGSRIAVASLIWPSIWVKMASQSLMLIFFSFFDGEVIFLNKYVASAELSNAGGSDGIPTITFR